jgi:hypothetical protein
MQVPTPTPKNGWSLIIAAVANHFVNLPLSPPVLKESESLSCTDGNKNKIIITIKKGMNLFKDFCEKAVIKMNEKTMASQLPREKVSTRARVEKVEKINKMPVL